MKLKPGTTIQLVRKINTYVKFWFQMVAIILIKIQATGYIYGIDFGQ